MILMAFGEAHICLQCSVYFLMCLTKVAYGSIGLVSFYYVSGHTGSLHFSASLRVRCSVNKGL